MGTIALTAPARVVACSTSFVEATAADVSVTDRGTVNAWTSGPRDQLVVRAMRGAPKAELRSAVIRNASEVLDGIGELRFSVPVDDPALADAFGMGDTYADGSRQVELLGNEVEWWRDGAVRWAGPVVSMEVDAAAGVAEFTAFDLGWYLSRVVVGKAGRRDLLQGRGSFDRFGTLGWTEVGGANIDGDTVDKVRGVRSMKITNGGAATYTVRFPAVSSGQDTTVRLTAMVKPATNTPVGSRLLSIAATPVGETATWRPLSDNDVTTGEDTNLGEWDRYNAYCLLKPGVDNDITVVLWAPTAAAIRFDDVRVLRNDTIGYPAPGADLTTHAVALVNHMQGKVKYGNVGLKRKVLSTSGTIEVMAVRHVEHTSILDLLDGLASREDGIDWWINPQTRTFCVAARRGTDKPDVPLSDRTVLAGGWTQDESERANSIIVLSDESGPERAEAGATDRAVPVLDYVHRAPAGTRLIALDPMAEGLKAQKNRPQVTLRPIRVPESWWTDHDLTPGDRLPQHFRAGRLRPPATDGWVRVSTIDHFPADGMLELS